MSSANSSSEKSVICPRICCVSTKLAHSWELAGTYLRYHTHREGTEKLLCPQLPKSNCSSSSPRLGGRHTEKSGVRLQERHGFTLQKTGYEAINAKRTLSQQQAPYCIEMCFRYRGECTSVHPASSVILVPYSMDPTTCQGWEHLSFMD